MKTYVANNYRVTLRDDGGIRVFIEGFIADIHIIYDPKSKYHWCKEITGDIHQESGSITGLRLPTWQLKILREALALVNKQDLFDNEIVFVNNEEK